MYLLPVHPSLVAIAVTTDPPRVRRPRGHRATAVRWRFLLVLAASGCGRDPILERADQEAAGEDVADAAPARIEQPRPPAASVGPGGGGAPAGGPAPPPPGGEPPPGQPGGGQPGGGQPGGGQPGGQPAEGGMQPSDPSGPMVSVSGSVNYAAWTGGMVRVDVFDGDQTNFSQRPRVLAMEQLTRPGPYRVSIPAGSGRIWISAFNDSNQNNRPDPRDPTGFHAGNPVTVGDKDVGGVDVVLEVRPPPADGQ